MSRVSIFNRLARGFSLIELLVALFILSLLAGIAAPHVERTVQRKKEIELRRSLRDVRTAIDQFHEDWDKGLIKVQADVASRDGYPRTLEVLVEGVPLTDGRTRKYLRRIPADPMATVNSGAGSAWRLKSYQDDEDSQTWGGEDVYDIATRSENIALDGTYYKDW